MKATFQVESWTSEVTVRNYTFASSTGLADLQRVIKELGITGKLTVNVSQGSVGSIVFEERVKAR